jgi:hypothetical protein
MNYWLHPEAQDGLRTRRATSTIELARRTA